MGDLRGVEDLGVYYISISIYILCLLLECFIGK